MTGIPVHLLDPHSFSGQDPGASLQALETAARPWLRVRWDVFGTCVACSVHLSTEKSSAGG